MRERERERVIIRYGLWQFGRCVDQIKFEQVVLKNIFMLLGDYDSNKVAHHFGKVETHTVLKFFQ